MQTDRGFEPGLDASQVVSYVEKAMLCMRLHASYAIDAALGAEVFAWQVVTQPANIKRTGA